MSNLILKVEEAEKYMKLGMPEGVEPLVEYIPYLLNRIYELERSLMPFARVGVQPPPVQGQLVSVYYKDCNHAFAKLSKEAALAVQPKPEEYLPAEG